MTSRLVVGGGIATRNTDVEYSVPCSLRPETTDTAGGILPELGRDLDGVGPAPSNGGVYRLSTDEADFDGDEQGYDTDGVVDTAVERQTST